MLSFSILQPAGILVLEPEAALTATDFERLRAGVDAYLATHATLRGVMIRAHDFPGWKSWAAFSAHMHFVHDHHRQVDRVALVTDSAIAGMAEWLGKHFIAAEIRHFPWEGEGAAMQWLHAA